MCTRTPTATCNTHLTHLHQLNPAEGIGFPALLSTLHAEQLPVPSGGREQASKPYAVRVTKTTCMCDVRNARMRLFYGCGAITSCEPLLTIPPHFRCYVKLGLGF